MNKILNLSAKQVIFLIIFAGVLVYSTTLFNGFVWDDEEQIVNNVIIQNLANFPQIFSGATFSTGGAGLSGWFFRPMLTLSFMLNYALWGANAYGFHLFQLTLHILNGVLLFKVLQLLTKKSSSPYRNLINLVASLIFVVQPGISEAVNYISALSEVALTSLNLLAFLFILKDRSSKIANYIYIALLLFGAMLFKESALVSLPILISFVLLYKPQKSKPLIITIIGTLLSYLFVRLIIVKTPIRHPEFSPISEASILHRLLTIPLEFFDYLRLFFYPEKLAVSQHYVVTSIFSSQFFLPLLIDILFIGLIIFLAWINKSKLILFGLVWFVLGFGLISNIFPLDMTIAERWFYFPIIGFILVLAAIVSIYSKEQLRKPIFIAFCIVLVIFSFRTIARTFDWRDGLTLYSHDNQISKDSFDLENNLGVELVRANQIDQAKPHFERSISLQPKWYFSYNNLGVIYQQKKDYKKAESLYLETLKRSDYYLAYENLLNVYLLQKDYKKSKDFAKNALRKLPNNPNLWIGLAVANYKLDNSQDSLAAFKSAYSLTGDPQILGLINDLKQGKKLNI